MRPLLTSLIAVALAVPAAAQFALENRKLSGPMAGDARSFVVRNGRVVYTADQDVYQQVEVYGVPADGSAAPVKLNGPLVAGGDVSDIALSSDGSTVVYTADAETDSTKELFSVPADGSGPPVKLNGPLSGGTSVNGFRIAPNGARVLYRAFHAGTLAERLYTVPIHGGTPSGFQYTAIDLDDIEFTPNSTRFVFDSGAGLKYAPVNGSNGAQSVTYSSFFIQQFALSVDAVERVRLVYLGGPLGDATRLYSTDLVNGSWAELSGTLVDGGNVTAFALSADGEHVVYRADRFEDERFVLSSTLVDWRWSPGPTVISEPMVAQGNVLDFDVSSAGDVVYLADQDVDGDERLYGVPVNGSAHAVLLNDQDLGFAPFAIAPDGAHVVITLGGLQALPMTGGSLVALSPIASTFQFFDEGQRLLHVEGERLRLTPIEGGRSDTLNPPPAGTLWESAFDGPRRVIYRAEQDLDGVIEIYSSLLEPIEPTPLPPGRPIRR